MKRYTLLCAGNGFGRIACYFKEIVTTTETHSCVAQLTKKEGNKMSGSPPSAASTTLAAGTQGHATAGTSSQDHCPCVQMPQLLLLKSARCRASTRRLVCTEWPVFKCRVCCFLSQQEYRKAAQDNLIFFSFSTDLIFLLNQLLKRSHTHCNRVVQHPVQLPLQKKRVIIQM